MTVHLKLATQSLLASLTMKERYLNHLLGAHCSDKGLFSHDVVEIVGGNCLVTVAVRTVDHLLQLLVRHGLTKFASHSAQVSDCDCARAVVVEEAEHFVYVFTSVSVAHPCSHHVEELLEVDVPALVLVQVRDHLVDRLVLGLEAE